MSAVCVVCPACGAVLRLRERPEPQLRAPCPDCGTRLAFADDATGELRANVAAADTSKPRRGSEPPRDGRRARPIAGTRTAVVDAWLPTARAAGGRLAARLSDPLAVIWLTALIAAVAIGWAFVRSESSQPSRPVRPNKARAEPPLIADETPPAEPVVKKPPAAVAMPSGSPTAVTQNAEAPATGPMRRRRPPVLAPRPVVPVIPPREAIAAALALRLLRFEQPTPVPFDRLRLQIEELAGHRVRYAATVDAITRDTPVSLSLTDTTLAEVLADLCTAVGLTYTVTDEGIRLAPAYAPPLPAQVSDGT